MTNTDKTTQDNGTQIEVAAQPSATKTETKKDGAVQPAPPQSIDHTLEGKASAQAEDTTAVGDVTTENAVTTTVIEAVPSVRDKILAARKAPEEVAKLVATQTEQLTVPLYKRPPDGFYWRVRSGGEWDPKAYEVLLLPRKDGDVGPEFLMVSPALEPLFNSDPRLRNMVNFYHMAFVVDARGRIGWWAVPSRSDNDWHISARAVMHRLAGEWGMLKPDMGAKCYPLESPVDDLGDPLWPAGSYDDWFVKGFTDKIIDSEDHPVLKKLLGKK